MPRPELRDGRAFDRLVRHLEESARRFSDRDRARLRSIAGDDDALRRVLEEIAVGVNMSRQLRNVAALEGIDAEEFKKLCRALIQSDSPVGVGKAGRDLIIDELRYIYCSGQAKWLG